MEDVLIQLIRLSAKLPSGSYDPKALEKARHEIEELEEAFRKGDEVEIALEMGDLIYYTAKALRLAAIRIGCRESQLLEAALTKYRLRARPGNPKNPREEYDAVASILFHKQR
jgi:phosphoribosyl-ATP pyrophosphohydrolase